MQTDWLLLKKCKDSPKAYHVASKIMGVFHFYIKIWVSFFDKLHFQHGWYCLSVFFTFLVFSICLKKIIYVFSLHLSLGETDLPCLHSFLSSLHCLPLQMIQPSLRQQIAAMFFSDHISKLLVSAGHLGFHLC